MNEAPVGRTVLPVRPTIMFTPDFHAYFMRLALREAAKAADNGEVPTGCVIIRRPESAETPLAAVRVLARAHNQTELLKDATAHAEMIALTQAAAALDSWRLEDCTLYVTLEPCPMCAGAIVLARVPRVVYGAADPKAGAVESLYQLLSDTRLNHQAEIVPGVLRDACGEVLSRFFQEKRRMGKK